MRASILDWAEYTPRLFQNDCVGGLKWFRGRLLPVKILSPVPAQVAAPSD